MHRLRVGKDTILPCFVFPKSMSDVHRENCLLVRSAQSRVLLLFSPHVKRIVGSTVTGTHPENQVPGENKRVPVTALE
jgi:hypothetical protein